MAQPSMPPPAVDRFRAVGQLLFLVAVTRLVAAYLVAPDQRPQGDQLAGSTILLLVHGTIYVFGAMMRVKAAPAYFFVQVTLVIAIGLFAQSLWFMSALLTILIAQAATLLLASRRTVRR